MGVVVQWAQVQWLMVPVVVVVAGLELAVV